MLVQAQDGAAEYLRNDSVVGQEEMLTRSCKAKDGLFRSLEVQCGLSTGSLSVYGNSSISGSQFISGGLRVGGGIFTSGGLVIGGGLTINGNLNVTGGISGASLVTTGDVGVGGNLTVTNGINFDTTLTGPTGEITSGYAYVLKNTTQAITPGQFVSFDDSGEINALVLSVSGFPSTSPPGGTTTGMVTVALTPGQTIGLVDVTGSVNIVNTAGGGTNEVSASLLVVKVG